MLELLNLTSLRTLDYSEYGNYLEIKVKNLSKPNSCPNCGFNKLYSHDKTKQTFFDTPMQGKSVVLTIQRMRYKCRSCGKTFREFLSDIDDKRLMTIRLKGYIQKRVMNETFAAVSRETGLDEKTIRHVFDDYIETKSKVMLFEVPRIIGIDELKLLGSYRCILTNIEKNSVFDMLATRKKQDIIQYLKKLCLPELVEVVVMDMWKPYKDAVKQILPNAKIVVDKFHLVRMANDGLENARKNIRTQLDRKERLKLKNERFVLLKRHQLLTEKEKESLYQWSDLFPALRLAYNAKESFFCLFEQGLDPEKAKHALVEWQRNLSPEIAHYFEHLSIALHNWKQEILNGFEYHVTNAYTESINRLAKDINRMARGYSFEVVRAKMLYDNKANKLSSITIRKKMKKSTDSSEILSYFVRKPDGKFMLWKKYYGAHIPTLCELLEEGCFD